MTNPQELARRYLASWEDYLAALLSEPSATQLWVRCSAIGGRVTRATEPGTESGSSPDRRLAPRPLSAHLTSAAALWPSSRAASPFWKISSPPSNETGRRRRALGEEIDACGPDQFSAALMSDRPPCHGFRKGLERTAATPTGGRPPQCRHLGGGRQSRSRLSRRTRRAAGAHHPVADQPLLRARFGARAQFLALSGGSRHASAGCRLGRAGPGRTGLDLGGYVERLDRAFTAASQSCGKPIAVVGYCMGGLLALALAQRGRHRSRVWLCSPHPGILLPSGRSRRVC